MLDYELVSKDGENATYRYFVEGRRKHAGIVSVSMLTSKCVVEAAEDDRHLRYAHHLCSRLRDFVASGVFRDSGTIMWY